MLGRKASVRSGFFQSIFGIARAAGLKARQGVARPNGTRFAGFMVIRRHAVKKRPNGRHPC